MAVALVAGVDRIFDMGRTTVNITGDAACTMVVSNLESKKDARRAKGLSCEAGDQTAYGDSSRSR